MDCCGNSSDWRSVNTGNVEGVKALKGIYSNSVDVNGSGEFLTESGKELIDELISELVEFVKKAETSYYGVRQ